MTRYPQATRLAPVLIVGLGRLRHGDDAVGLVVARWAARRLSGLADVLVDLGGWDTLDALEGRRLLVVVDAAEPQARFPPGAWLRIEPDAQLRALSGCCLRDTHTAGLDSMLRLAGRLGQLPPAVWIYAVAGRQFNPEERISAPLRRIALTVADAIVADVRAWSSP